MRHKINIIRQLHWQGVFWNRNHCVLFAVHNCYTIFCHPGLDPGSRSWIPAFAGMTKKYDLWRAFVYTLILILLSVALFVTFSRGVIIVGGVLFLIWLAHLWRNNKEYRKLIIFVCILLFTVNCLLLTIYWPYISSRYDLVALAGSQSVNLRSFYNQEAIKMIWQKPLLGVGFGNFVPALKQAVSLSDWQYQPAHNIYLLAAAENGLPALLAFLAFLFLTLRSAWPCRKNLSVNCLLFTVCCLLFLGLFDHFLWDLQQGQILFWLMLGLLASFSPRS